MSRVIIALVLFLAPATVRAEGQDSDRRILEVESLRRLAEDRDLGGPGIDPKVLRRELGLDREAWEMLMPERKGLVPDRKGSEEGLSVADWALLALLSLAAAWSWSTGRQATPQTSDSATKEGLP
jgi:hypothetical protein